MRRQRRPRLVREGHTWRARLTRRHAAAPAPPAAEPVAEPVPLRPVPQLTPGDTDVRAS